MRLRSFFHLVLLKRHPNNWLSETAVNEIPKVILIPKDHRDTHFATDPKAMVTCRQWAPAPQPMGQKSGFICLVCTKSEEKSFTPISLSSQHLPIDDDLN